MRTHSWWKHGRRLLSVTPLLWFIACSSDGVTGGPTGSAGSSGSSANTSGAPAFAGAGGAPVSNGGAPVSNGGAPVVGGGASGFGAGAGGMSVAVAGAGAGGSAAGAVGGPAGGANDPCQGVTCGTGQTCSNGSCMCMTGMLCSDGCFDTQNDLNHCGGCTTKCAADGACVSGKCVNPTCNPDTQERSGHITTYNLATPLVACHYPTSTLPQYYGAMNEYDWNNSGVCGACVEITNSANGKKLTVQITDECPYKGNEQWCFQGSHHIDLNGAAYNSLGANNNPATTWKYVACSTTGNLKYNFDKASQQYYLAVTPMNARNLVAKMEVMTKDGYKSLTHTNYNTYELTTGAGTGALTFRLTDIYNHIVTETVTLSAGQVVQGNKQFAACP
jgi:expansin (peptidoglycan-binding protein)